MASPEGINPPQLLTKQQLKADAVPRDRERGASTDEETPLGLQMPEDTTTDSDSPYSSNPGRSKKQSRKGKDE